LTSSAETQRLIEQEIQAGGFRDAAAFVGAAALHSSAALGRQVAALLDIEQAVPGVTVSPVRPELRVIGVLTAVSGPLDRNAGDLDLTAGWGHGGKGGVPFWGKRASSRNRSVTESITRSAISMLPLSLAM
jgi:hypothetical protein